MTFYKCKHCGKIIAIVNDKHIPTFCCGEIMEEIPVNTSEGAHEKHIPVYEIKDNIVTVKVGEVEHPMMDAHYIEWIMIETKDKPEAKFALLPEEKVLRVLEYCNLHGLYAK